VEEAVVVDSVRTPLAKSYRGSLNATRSDDMVAHCLRSILDRRPALRDGEIDDVILGWANGRASSGLAHQCAGDDAESVLFIRASSHCHRLASNHARRVARRVGGRC
jgi:acetyl-CoA acetyltransferase